MTAPLAHGQCVSFVEDGRVRTGTIDSTWKSGRRAVVKTPEGEVFVIRADQVGAVMSQSRRAA